MVLTFYLIAWALRLTVYTLCSFLPSPRRRPSLQRPRRDCLSAVAYSIPTVCAISITYVHTYDTYTRISYRYGPKLRSWSKYAD